MRIKLLFFLFLFLTVQLSFSQIKIENKIEKNTGSNNPSSSFAKSTTLKFEPIYFVLGTLSDYMGRFQYVDKENQVDRYYPYEKPLVNYLTGYINKEMNLKVDAVFEKSNHCKMYSSELAKILNGFYGAKGELINDKFETNEQIYSFLAGVYYRYGEKLDTSIYKIQMANSPKHKNCYDFLKLIGCKKIFYKYLHNIPAVFILYFEPTDELKRYLNLIEANKLLLKESFDSEFKHVIDKDFEKRDQKFRQIEVENIRNAFY